MQAGRCWPRQGPTGHIHLGEGVEVSPHAIVVEARWVSTRLNLSRSQWAETGVAHRGLGDTQSVKRSSNFECCFKGDCSQRAGAAAHLDVWGPGRCWSLQARSKVLGGRRSGVSARELKEKVDRASGAPGGRHTGVVRFCTEGQVRQVWSGVNLSRSQSTYFV